MPKFRPISPGRRRCHRLGALALSLRPVPRARPIVNDFRATTSVVVPSFHEDPDILMSAWSPGGRRSRTRSSSSSTSRIWRPTGASRPWGPRCGRFCSSTSASAPRSARASGWRTYEILVLTDSDTWWPPGLLPHVQMPFADPRSGRSAPSRTCTSADTSIWRRIADWMVNLRYYDYVPAMGQAVRSPACPAVPRPTGASAVAPGAREPRERVLPRPPLHRRRRRSADVAGARLGLQDRPPVLGAGAVDVPRHASGPSSSSGCAGAGTRTAAT